MMTVDGNKAAKTKEHEMVDPRNLEFLPMWSFEHGRFAALTQLEQKQAKGTHCSTTAGIARTGLPQLCALSPVASSLQTS